MKKSTAKAQAGLILKIKVEPRSSKSEVVGPYGDALKVKLTSPPVEGKANKELIEVLAREFGISKKDVGIISGQASKIKTVKLIGVKRLDDRKGK